eukprot:UN33660
MKMAMIKQAQSGELQSEAVANRLLKKVETINKEKMAFERRISTQQTKPYIGSEDEQKQIKMNIDQRKGLDKSLVGTKVPAEIVSQLTKLLAVAGVKKKYVDPDKNILVQFNTAIHNLVERNKQLNDDNDVLINRTESLQNEVNMLKEKIAIQINEIKEKKYLQAKLIGEMEVEDERGFNNKRSSVSSQSSTRSLTGSVSASSNTDTLNPDRHQAVFASINMASQSPQRRPEPSPLNVSQGTSEKDREMAAFKALSLEESAISTSPSRSRSLSGTLKHPLHHDRTLAGSLDNVDGSNQPADGSHSPNSHLTVMHRASLPRIASPERLLQPKSSDTEKVKKKKKP